LDLTINGVDYFGSNRQPRVIYAKIVQNPELIKLRKQVNNVLSDIDIAIEKKKFIPHITLARLNRTSYQSVGQFIQFEALFKTDVFTLDTLYLFSTKMKPDGAQYFIEESSVHD
jgi:2'-5' RNA ligase